MTFAHDDDSGSAVSVSGDLAEHVAALDADGPAAEPVPVVTAGGARAYLISEELLEILRLTLPQYQLQVAAGEAFAVPLEDLVALTEGQTLEPDDITPPEDWLVADERGQDG
ncbi:hypothetical protein [Nonomuraea sp. NPDC049400]|uniref:hypothetical protein n=1 Tax=Nonomuraea sp. NPDC049400 TaxID=3364352 RepID=UPI0037A8136D